jgi:hypothetical protein
MKHMHSGGFSDRDQESSQELTMESPAESAIRTGLRSNAIAVATKNCSCGHSDASHSGRPALCDKTRSTAPAMAKPTTAVRKP